MAQNDIHGAAKAGNASKAKIGGVHVRQFSRKNDPQYSHSDEQNFPCSLPLSRNLDSALHVCIPAIDKPN